MKQKFFTILAVMLMSLTANAQHEYVDLGLPSGTLWATCNIGADSPEEVGTTFNWSQSDIATANWGSEWRMPTDSQCAELLYYKTHRQLTSMNGVDGVMFTGKNGNSIFLPEANYLIADSKDFYVVSYDNPYLIDKISPSPEYGKIRPVRAQGPKYTISNIPDGWEVNGWTTNGTYESEEGRQIIFTPANIPAGKKIKSIKVVKQ